MCRGPLPLDMIRVMNALEAWDLPAGVAPWPRPGELWVRWGIDGVVRWSTNSYLTLSVALTSRCLAPEAKQRPEKAVLLAPHSRKRFGLAAILQTPHEDDDSVAALVEGCRLNAALTAMEGMVVQVGAQHVRLRHFFLADHMCMRRLVGAVHRGDARAQDFATMERGRAWNTETFPHRRSVGHLTTWKTGVRATSPPWLRQSEWSFHVWNRASKLRP